MANTTISVNSLKDVSPSAGQLKTNLSNRQKAQLEVLNGLPGSVGRPGRITGSVSNSLSGANKTTVGTMSAAASLAGALDNAGIHNDVTRRLLTEKVSPALNAKVGIIDRSNKTPTDLSIKSNRLPSIAQKSATEKMDETRIRLMGEGDLGYQGTAFPPDLAARTPAFIMLHFHTYTRGNAFSKGSLSGGTKVFLPLPENFQQIFAIQADSKDLTSFSPMMKGALENGGADFLGNKTADQAYESIKEMGSAFLDEMKKEENAVRDEARAIAARAAIGASSSVGAEGLAAAAQAAVGSIPNPHPTAFFQGIPLRRFSWQWKFVPRKQSEADALRSILKTIKKEILPEASGGFLNSPSFVQPSVEGQNKLDIKFKKSMITQFSINYTAEGTSAFFHDGSPVSVLCGMEFTEMELFLKGDL